MIIKRSPNTDAARYGLALVVDVGALLDGESNYWSERGTGRRLTLPDGTVLFADGTMPASPQFTRALSG